MIEEAIIFLTISAFKYYCLRVFATKLVFIIFFPLSYTSAQEQLKLKGTVYDESGIFPLQAVSVVCSSGKGTITDSAGHYTLIVTEKDSVWFSYLGKETNRFVIAEVPDLNDFNISLRINIHVLKEVKIRPADYKLDSIQNRIDYAKVFNYKKPTFKSIVPVIGLGFVVDLDELIRAFQLRQKRMMVGFQKRLLEEEHQKFVLHRFNKLLVSEITGLKDEMLDSFMVKYRPSYSFVIGASDYALRKYIKDMYEIHKLDLLQNKRPDD